MPPPNQPRVRAAGSEQNVVLAAKPSVEPRDVFDADGVLKGS